MISWLPGDKSEDRVGLWEGRRESQKGSPLGSESTNLGPSHVTHSFAS